MPRGVFLRQRNTQQARGGVDRMIVLFDLRFHAAFGRMLGQFVVARNYNDQVVSFSAALRANLRGRVRERLLQPLEIFKQLGVALPSEERLDFVALFARKLANFRDADRHDRQVRIHGKGLLEGFLGLSEPACPLEHES